METRQEQVQRLRRLGLSEGVIAGIPTPEVICAGQEVLGSAPREVLIEMLVGNLWACSDQDFDRYMRLLGTVGASIQGIVQGRGVALINEVNASMDRVVDWVKSGEGTLADALFDEKASHLQNEWLSNLNPSEQIALQDVLKLRKSWGPARGFDSLTKSKKQLMVLCKHRFATLLQAIEESAKKAEGEHLTALADWFRGFLGAVDLYATSMAKKQA